jgi:hypothetical protein
MLLHSTGTALPGTRVVKGRGRLSSIIVRNLRSVIVQSVAADETIMAHAWKAKGLHYCKPFKIWRAKGDEGGHWHEVLLVP